MRAAQALSIAIVAACISQAAAQTPSALGLAQAVDAVLENSPSMRSARLGIEGADNHAAEVRAEHVPKIRVSENVIRSNSPVFVFGSLLEQGRFGAENFALPFLNNPPSLTNLRTVVSTDWPVFDGFKTSARIAQSGIGKEQAVRQKGLAEQRVRFGVVRDYFGVLVAEATLEVAGEGVRMSEADIKRVRDRMDAGLAVQSDLLAAQVQLAEFKQQRIQAEGNVAIARAVLNVSMGSPSTSRQTLTVELLKKTFDVPEPGQLVDRALLHRPDYQQAQSGIELADQHISESRSEYFPEVNLFASFGSSGRNLTTGSTDYTVGAGISFNVFDSGRPARVGQALVDKRLAQTERDRVRDQIEIEVVQAYNHYRAAAEQVEVAEAALSQATEGLRIIQDRYDAGLTTITDVLRAETALVRIRMNVAVSRHDHYLGYANVLLSTGELNDVTAFEP
jgi:outer membrane protein TolC